METYVIILVSLYFFVMCINSSIRIYLDYFLKPERKIVLVGYETETNSFTVTYQQGSEIQNVEVSHNGVSSYKFINTDQYVPSALADLLEYVKKGPKGFWISKDYRKHLETIGDQNLIG